MIVGKLPTRPFHPTAPLGGPMREPPPLFNPFANLIFQDILCACSSTWLVGMFTLSLRDEDRRRLNQATDNAQSALSAIQEHSKSCDMRQVTIERSLSTLERAVDDIQKANQKILWWAVGALLSGIAGLLANHIPPIHIG